MDGQGDGCIDDWQMTGCKHGWRVGSLLRASLLPCSCSFVISSLLFAPPAHYPFLIPKSTVRTEFNFFSPAGRMSKWPKLSLSPVEISFLYCKKSLSLYPYYTVGSVLRSLWSVRGHHPDDLQESRPETLLKVESPWTMSSPAALMTTVWCHLLRQYSQEKPKPLLAISSPLILAFCIMWFPKTVSIMFISGTPAVTISMTYIFFLMS